MAIVDNHHPVGMFTDLTEARARLDLASDAALRLARYRDAYAALAASPGGAAKLGERARDAENDMRILLRGALDTINDFYDSGEAGGAIAAVEAANLGPALDLGKIFSKAVGLLAEQKIDLDPSLVTEVQSAVAQIGLKASVAGGSVVVEARSAKQSFAFDRRPGDFGRVSASSFFGKVGPRVRVTGSAAADPDTHHEEQQVSGAAGARVDAYGAMIAALAQARDAMADHRAVAEYFGRPHILAEGLIAAVVLIIVGVILTAVGVTLTVLCTQGQLNTVGCAFGLALFVLGGAVFVVGTVVGTNSKNNNNNSQTATIGDDGAPMPA
jgi:hypothetical protein